jgi:NAD(P)H-dependent FMN reductase
MDILAISGSLRAASSNSVVIRAAALLAPPQVSVTAYTGLVSIPPFNPDDDGDAVPPTVADLRSRIATAGAVLICSPEYAHGVPGVLKNALDWLVGGIEIVDKPVALINASSRATIAQAQLARVSDRASVTIPLTGRPLDEFALAADYELASTLRRALAALAFEKPSGSAAIS